MIRFHNTSKSYFDVKYFKTNALSSVKLCLFKNSHCCFVNDFTSEAKKFYSLSEDLHLGCFKQIDFGFLSKLYIKYLLYGVTQEK